MEKFSLYHWLVVLGIIFLFLYPISRILRRAGFSGAWCLLCITPFTFFIALWIFAFNRWPALGETPDRPRQSRWQPRVQWPPPDETPPQCDG